MADNIFVGSVSVGVVPDLTGFNEKMRKELLPAANRIGRDMGKEITSGIIKEFDIAKVVKSVTPKATVAAKVMGTAMGREAIKGFGDVFDIGKIVLEATVRAKPQARLAGRALGDVYGREFRRGLDDALKGIKPKVDIDINKASLARAAKEVRDSVGGSVKVGVSKGVGDGVSDATKGPNSGKIGNEIGSFFGTGILSGLAGLPPQVQIGLGAAAAAAAPFIGQVIGGSIISVLGTGLLAVGVAGAVGVGKTVPSRVVTEDQQKLDAANQRVIAAQQRLNTLQGGGATSASALASARASLASAQDGLNRAEGSGTTTALGLHAASLRVSAAQDRLNKLQSGGKASTQQLASAEARLETARATQSAAQHKRQIDAENALTKGQEGVRKSFENLQNQFTDSLSKIGQSFVPVLNSLAGVASGVLGKITPVFTTAVKALAEPFANMATVFLKSLADPQVVSAIQAVANAFADIMIAFAPDIPGIVNSFADSIERIANAVAKNPKAFADFLNFIFQIGILALNTIAYLTDIAVWIEKNWNWIRWIVIPEIIGLELAIHYIIKFRHDIAHWFDDIRHYVSNQWDLMWQDTIGNTIRAQRHLQILITAWLHNLAHWFDVARHDVAHIWDLMWQDTVGSTIRQQRHLQQLITSWLHNLAHWFDVARHDVSAAWDSMWSHLFDWAVKGWGKIYNNVWVPVRDFFTRTLPGWFRTAVNSIGDVWDKIRAKISAPIQWVAAHVLGGLFDAIDKITSFVGIGAPLKGASDSLKSIGKARGGYISQGDPGRDSVFSMLRYGEVVVPTEMVNAGAVDHLRGMLPDFPATGYAHGGRASQPNKVVKHPDSDVGYIFFPGVVPQFASGGQVEQSMLNFMLSKRGQPYSEAQRWGMPPWDCSSLVWTAANRAGVPIPQSQAIAASEANWFGGYPGTYTYGNRMMTQAGDILAFTGAAPGQSRYGGVGHIGMAANSSTMISALGSRYGVTLSGIGQDFVQGFRLGGPGGKNILSKIGAFIGGAFRTLGDIFSGLKRFGSIGIDLAKGNVSGAIRALLGQFKPGTGGASGDLGRMLLGLPPKLVGEVLKKIVGSVKSFASSQQSVSGAPGVPPAHGSALAAQNYARAHLAQFGWGPGQFPPLLSLWQGESGWNANAVNPGSGAMGIPQALGHGHVFNLGDYANQVMWGLNYIKGSYGSPAAALAKWLSRSPHWYGRGTGSDGAAAGWGIVGENGPEFVNFHGGETVLPHGMIPGYASGAAEQLIRAEIQRDQVQLRVLENSLRLAGTAIARAHYQAEIRVEQARIAVLNENLRKLTSAHVTSLNRLAATQIRAFQTAGATVAAAYAKITTATTPASYASDLSRFLKEIRLYFTPSVANARSNLVISQNRRMQSLETQIKDLATKITNANALQKQVQASIQRTTGLTTIGIQGQGRAQSYNLLASLRSQTGIVRNFGTSIRDLARAGASSAVLQSVALMDPTSGTTYAKSMTRALRRLHGIKAPQSIINQLVAAGPEAANAYVDAITAAGPTVRNQIFAAANALAAAQLGASRGATSLVSGGGYNTGASFIAGLRSQQTHLNNIFKGLGRTMAQEAIRWFNVPANRRPHGYQHGGWIEEPISGVGLWSGSPYTFAENGRREYVISGDDIHPRGHDGSSHGTEYHAHFDGLTRAAIESHVRTAFSAMSLTQGSFNRQGRRT
jgi:hypothetical protein